MILVNGEPGEKIGAADRGLAYGDGVFRTLLIRGSRPEAWPHHYRKLQHDCAALALACPPEKLLRDELARAVPPAGDCAAKILVTRGTGERGYAPPPAAVQTRVVMTAPLPQHPTDYFSRGVAVRVCALRLALQPALAGIKHLNRLENVLARTEWTDPAIAEGILLDNAGRVVSGTMSNLMIFEGEALATPALSRCGVAGVTRERVLGAAARRGMVCSETDIDIERLMRADAVLLMNSLIGVWQVATLGERQWAPQAIAQHVRKWLDEADS